MPTAARTARAKARQEAEAKASLARSIQARYDAAGTGRRLSSWTPPSSGPARAIDGTERIRNRARDSVRNDWGGESSAQKWTTSLIGVGVTPRWEDEALGSLWDEFVPFADADGTNVAYGLQALAARTWLISGECFLRRRWRDLRLPLPVPVQVQVLESEMCPMFDSDTWPGMPAGNTIRQGIERNVYGRRIAYWMHKEHPGEPKSTATAPVPGMLVRVMAQDISHVFEPQRPGQLRGVSHMAQILVRLRSSMDFEDAVLDRQKLANLWAAFVKRSMPPERFAGEVEYDPLTGLPRFYNTSGTPVATLEPGMVQELAVGEDITFANPPESGTSYPDYMRTTHMGTAAGQGLPYELFSGDLRDVSDRTLRVAINEFRRFAEQRQWHLVIPRICQPMVDWWAEAAVLASRIPRSRLPEAKRPEHSPHGWAYIHPVQDVEGKIKAIDAGLTSQSAEIAKQGDDPRKVFRQRAKDQATEGAQPTPAAAPGGAQPAEPPEPPDDPNGRVLDAMVAQTQALASRPAPEAVPVDAIVAATAAAVAAAMQPFLAQAAETNAALLAALRASAERPTLVSTTVEPTPLNVTNNVTNNVEPTPINNVVNVQPADVNVTLPDRETTSVIERDADGNIVNVTQTETTLQ